MNAECRIHVYMVQMWKNSAECERVCRYENLDLANQARVGGGGVLGSNPLCLPPVFDKMKASRSS